LKDNPSQAYMVLPGTEDVTSTYERLSVERQEVLDRARDNALYTIPALVPPEGHSPGQRLYIPYQSIGSFGVNSLTAKLVSTLLPANNPVFRFSVSDEVVEELTSDPKQRSGVDKKLNEIERSVMDEIERLSIRASLTEGIKQLLVAGNVLLYLPKTGGLKMFRLDRYVVQRDFEGNILRVIIKETVAREALPIDVQEILTARDSLPSDTPSTPDSDETDTREVDVYTVFNRKGDRIHTFQWIKGFKLPRSMGEWPLDKSPIMALRLNYLHDEDYGRAYIDEYIGDLTAVEKMSQNIREGVAAMTKINPMVNPTGLTRSEDVAKAENLEIIAGRKEDVTMLQFEKQADLKFAGEFLNTIISRLQTAFLMNKSAQRDAERVTAEEFRSVIKDIDDTLGGIYTLLANDLQTPLVKRILYRMEKQKRIPRISALKGADGKPVAEPTVITGIEALGRGHDYNKYRTFMQEIILPIKEVATAEINIPDFIKRAAISLSIDTDGLLKTEEDKAADKQKLIAEQQQNSQLQMMQDVVKGAVPAVAKAGADGIAQQLVQQQEGAA